MDGKQCHGGLKHESRMLGEWKKQTRNALEPVFKKREAATADVIMTLKGNLRAASIPGAVADSIGSVENAIAHVVYDEG